MTNSFQRAEYYMPAEWEPHKATWLQWPHEDKWEHYQLKLENIWLQIVDALHSDEKVNILVQDERRRDHVVNQLLFHGIGTDHIDFYIIPTDDVWIRDNGPIFVKNIKNSDIAVTDWIFNGWGSRYACELDNLVPGKIAESINVPCITVPMVIEGGSVEINGKGTFIATKTSIINTNRNPDYTKEQIEEKIKTHLGISNIIWLSGVNTSTIDIGWSDDTDTHIDLAARFVNENTVVYPFSEENEPRYQLFCRHLEELKAAKTEKGKELNLIPLQVPTGGIYSTSKIGAGGGIQKSNHPNFTNASYTNFYIGNKSVLVPVFGNKNDDNALKIIDECFPDRDIIGINCVALVENGGMLHCVTQQEPV